jgi:trimethylamine--corrinoid protein Co-methyltransferase
MAKIRLEFLSQQEIQKLHDTAMRILGEIGLKFHDDTLPDRFQSQSGLTIDRQSQVILFSEAAVMQAVAQVPPLFHIHGRDRSRKVTYGGSSFVTMSIPGEAHWVEPASRRRRQGTLEDFAAAVTVADALPNIDVVGGMIKPIAFPTAVYDVYTYAELFKRTRKPVRSWISNGRTAHYVIKLLEVLAGGSAELRAHPLAEFGLEPISPLELPRDGLDGAIEFARAGQPIVLGPMPQAMGTAPATLAGAVALGHAESLGALTIIQSIAPGTPMIYYSAPHIMDPQTMNLVFGSPEQGLMAVAVAQLGQHYGLPVGVNVGLTDANLPDAQSGLEKSTTLLMGALAGANAFGGMGIAGCDQGFSLPQLIIDDETIGFVKRIVRGMDVNDDTCAFDTIQRTGIGGNFLLDDHTLAHWREEFWIPRLGNRLNWPKWLEASGKTMAQRAAERQEQILSEHETDWLDEAVQRELDAIVLAAEREILGS